MIDETQRKKRLEDEIAGAKAGFDTSAEDDARLQQSSGEDQFAEEAEQTIKFLREKEPYFWRLHNPQELEKLKEELIQSAMEQAGLRRREPQEQELRLYDKAAHDKFWGDPAELRRVGKLVRQPKL